jgi:hypothetical protein
MRRTLRAALAALVLASASLAACQPTVSPYDVVEPNVFVGPQRTCAELELSDIRCTILQLRAAAALDAQRPGHAGIASRTLHAEGAPPAGQSIPPRTTTIPVIVVFNLEDGSRIAIPTHCPRLPDAGDEGCDTRVR